MAESSPNPVADPRFEYEDIAPPALPVAQLDLMMASILDPEPVKKMGVYGLIVNGLKIAVVLAWLIAREKLIAAQRDLAKQKYERGQAGKNQGDLDRDNLSGEKRPVP